MNRDLDFSGARSARRLLRRWWSVALFLVIGVAFTIDRPYTNSPSIRSDGLGYHAWTRALIDGHVSFCPYEELRAVAALQPASDVGRCANKYPPGLALLRFPVMAPFTAANGGGLRSGYEDAVNDGLSLLAGAVAMSAAIATSVRLKGTDATSNIAALAVAFGSNLFHFATYDASFTHVYSAALAAALMLVVVRAGVDRRRIGPTEVIIVAATVGFLVDIRALLVAPLTAVGLALATVEVRTTSLRRSWEVHRRLAIAAAVGATTALLQQMLYNRFIFGEWRLSAYVGEEFIWSQFKQFHVLFSMSRGVFLWAPVMGMALVTVVVTRQWVMLCTIVLATGTLTVIYGAWHAWDLAGGFGHRGFVEVTPLYAAGLGVGLARMKAPWRRASYATCCVLAIMALGLMRGYWSGELGFYGATNAEWVRYSVGSKSLLAHYLRSVLT